MPTIYLHDVRVKKLDRSKGAVWIDLYENEMECCSLLFRDVESLQQFVNQIVDLDLDSVRATRGQEK